MSTETLSLVVPVFNEAAHLDQWCTEIFAFDFGIPAEFIVVDDASTDDSVAIIQKHAVGKNVKVLTQKVNQGKGAALARGIRETTGSIVIIQDADFEYAFRDVPEVIRPIVENEADIVFGSRYKNSYHVHRTFHYAINRALTIASNIASGLYVTDMETCYKAFRGEIIRGITIESPRFGFEPEITAKISRLKARVAEIPVHYFPRNYIEGKKINWKDGLAAFWHIARFNGRPRKLDEAVAAVPERFRVSARQWL